MLWRVASASLAHIWASLHVVASVVRQQRMETGHSDNVSTFMQV